jgi:DNA-binding response OmpR family regulator
MNCETCGQPIPPQLELTPIQTRIYETLKTSHRTADQLREIVWADDPDGGPACLKTIHVHISHLNRRLRPYGFVIRVPWRGMPYRLLKVEGANETGLQVRHLPVR